MACITRLSGKGTSCLCLLALSDSAVLDRITSVQAGFLSACCTVYADACIAGSQPPSGKCVSSPFNLRRAVLCSASRCLSLQAFAYNSRLASGSAALVMCMRGRSCCHSCATPASASDRKSVTPLTNAYVYRNLLHLIPQPSFLLSVAYASGRIPVLQPNQSRLSFSISCSIYMRAVHRPA